MHSPKAIANYFLKKAWEKKSTLTPIQVIKLVYIAHGWKLAVFQEGLISEPVEAWQYGPVIPTLYHEFKNCGNQPIHTLAKEATYKGHDPKYVNPNLEDYDLVEAKSNFSEQEKEVMDAVWEKHGKWKGFQLSELTHRDGSPWHTAYIKDDGFRKDGALIDDDLIKKYYSQLLTSVIKA